MHRASTSVVPSAVVGVVDDRRPRVRDSTAISGVNAWCLDRFVLAPPGLYSRKIVNSVEAGQTKRGRTFFDLSTSMHACTSLEL